MPRSWVRFPLPQPPQKRNPLFVIRACLGKSNAASTLSSDGALPPSGVTSLSAPAAPLAPAEQRRPRGNSISPQRTPHQRAHRPHTPLRTGGLSSPYHKTTRFRSSSGQSGILIRSWQQVQLLPEAPLRPPKQAYSDKSAHLGSKSASSTLIRTPFPSPPRAHDTLPHDFAPQNTLRGIQTTSQNPQLRQTHENAPTSPPFSTQ